MSLRYFSVRLYRNGRYFLQKYIHSRKYNINISEDSASKAKLFSERAFRAAESVPRQSAIRNVGYAVGLHARKLFIENVLCKVNHGFSSTVRKQVTQRLFFGDAAPLFAFVGVSLASGSGFLSRQDELEGLCWEIRNAVSKFQWHLLTDDGNEPVLSQEEIKLDNLTIGNLIAKGCSAVVYAAKVNDKTPLNDNTSDASAVKQSQDIHFCSESKAASVKVESEITDYPLALKMMFNYDVQSSSLAILRAMYQETIPARRFFTNDICFWENSLRQNKLNLPAHPNIVAMYSVFADYMPKLPGSMQVYPDALPSSFNPEGSGRNMTLFLLMKRYQYSLAEFLKQHPPVQRDSVLLLAQLLEGLAHMNLHGIAHRDLKSDNILVDRVTADDDSSVPVLVITDFGCCLADRVYGLEIPYKTDQMDKGGNMTLMAPEVILQTPGTFSFLNYTKSDLWAAGTIAYEIFGYSNPFYVGQSNESKKSEVLRNVSYKESQLPSLEEKTPVIIRKLIGNMLKRNPNARLSAEVASNICQLFLWAPSTWLKSERMPSNQEIMQWLLCLTTKVLCEGRLSNQPCELAMDISPSFSSRSRHSSEVITKKSARRSHPEYILISSFLCRAKLFQIKQALLWIQANNA